MPKKERGLSRRVGTLVRALRKELRWSKAKLAQLAGCNERTVANVENARWVSDQTLTAITDALNKGLREQNNNGQLRLPFATLTAADLFEYDDHVGHGKARVGPRMPDERRVFLKAFLGEIAKREVAS